MAAECMTAPRLRMLELFPVQQQGETLVALRDPQGFTPTALVSYPAGILASLMDGRRDLAAIQREFHQQTGQNVALTDLQAFTRHLDEACLLEGPRFEALYQEQVAAYLAAPARPAAHAGGAYAADPAELRAQLRRLFTAPEGPGEPLGEPAGRAAAAKLRGVLSPHIDLHRGGTTFAWAYKRLLEESDADVFVIFGTAHTPMRQLFSVLRKDFETPLGTVAVDHDFIARLADGADGESPLQLFDDDLAHRHEHSIEFQVVFLQYLLGQRRPFKIVPVLTGSFHQFVTRQRPPREAVEVQRFVRAMRRAEEATASGTPVSAMPAYKVCYISGGDLAHVGRRFGDRHMLADEHLAELAQDDNQLLSQACRADSEAFFTHVARQRDQRRICGLSPTYTLLEVARPTRGELLRYDQAVAEDGSSCVSFASVAFYGD